MNEVSGVCFSMLWMHCCSVFVGRALSAIIVLYVSLYIVGQCPTYARGYNFFVVDVGCYANTTQVVAMYFTPLSKVTPRCS